MNSWPLLGCGVGLRAQHYPEILERFPAMDWFEAVSENYMDSEGRPIAVLEKIRARYPVGLHGVALSIGSADPLSETYLERLARLVRRIEPAIVSDHLCWTGVDGENLHDLLPLPFTEEAVAYVAARAARVQERLGRRILLENISAYVTYRHSTMPEWEFLAAVARRAGCGVLLDLNNIYVNSVNHGFDPLDYLHGIPAAAVGQFHLGGHADKGTFLFDTHGAAVAEAVWKLYAEALALYGPVSTLIEWDEDIPGFTRLSQEADRARQIYRRFEKADKPAADFPRIPLPPMTDAPQLRRDQTALKERIRLRREGKSLEAVLHPQGGVPGGERMAVYAGAYLARMAEALKETFEAVARFAGEAAFIDLCEGYVEAYPSGEYNLSEIGHSFAAYAAKTSYAAKLPFIKDLASLEWAVSRAFHAPGREPARMERFAGWDDEHWSRARIRVQEGCSLLRSAWPVADLWNARKMPEGRIDVAIEGRPQTVFVYRAGLDVRVRVVSAAEAAFLERVAAGDSLGEILASFEGGETPEPPVGEWFTALSRDGLIADVQA